MPITTRAGALQVTVIGHSFKLLLEDCTPRASHAEHSLPAGHKRAADGDGDAQDISVPRSRQLHSPPKSKKGTKPCLRAGTLEARAESTLPEPAR